MNRLLLSFIILTILTIYVYTKSKENFEIDYHLVQGKRGEQGEMGNTGLDGDQGEDGNEGMQGPKGHEGPTGSVGVTGKVGEEGDQGPSGKVGEDTNQTTQTGADWKDLYISKHVQELSTKPSNKNIINSVIKKIKNTLQVDKEDDSEKNKYIPAYSIISYYLIGDTLNESTAKDWQICDGTQLYYAQADIGDPKEEVVGNNTPNLVDKFIMGSKNNDNITSSDDTTSITLNEEDIPKHSHTISSESLNKLANENFKYVNFLKQIGNSEKIEMIKNINNKIFEKDKYLDSLYIPIDVIPYDIRQNPYHLNDDEHKLVKNTNSDIGGSNMNLKTDENKLHGIIKKFNSTLLNQHTDEFNIMFNTNNEDSVISNINKPIDIDEFTLDKKIITNNNTSVSSITNILPKHISLVYLIKKPIKL